MMSKEAENTLHDVYKKIQEILKQDINSTRHPFHTGSLATISLDKKPKARTVVIRKLDEVKRQIFFHTDIRSPKIQELKNNPYIELCFYAREQKMQLRFSAQAMIHYQNDIAKKSWENSALSSRKCYLSEIAPSSVTGAGNDSLPSHLKGIVPSEEETEAGFQNFTVIECNYNQIDFLTLSYKGHQRARVSWEGGQMHTQWLIP